MRGWTFAVSVSFLAVVLVGPTVSAHHWYCDPEAERRVENVNASVYAGACVGVVVSFDDRDCESQMDRPVHVLENDGCHTGATVSPLAPDHRGQPPIHPWLANLGGMSKAVLVGGP